MEKYVEGWEASNYPHSQILLKCQKCGNVIVRNRYYIHKLVAENKHIRCPICDKKEPQRTSKRTMQEIRKVQKEVIRRYNEGETPSQIAKSGICHLSTVYNVIKNKETYKHYTCEYCGKEFDSTCNSRRFCSDKCCHDWWRQKNRKAFQRTRSKYQGISLPLLIQRDNNICYLCGEECDSNDYTYVNDHFCMGKKYPTIEHLIPMSRGGTNTWDNVKLAHNSCNATKGVRKHDEG